MNSAFVLLRSPPSCRNTRSRRRSVRCARVDAFDNSQHRLRFFQSRRRRTLEANVLEKFSHLDLPRLITAWKFPDGRLRRTHLRQHFVVGEPFESVTSAETFPVQLAVASVNLE